MGPVGHAVGMLHRAAKPAVDWTNSRFRDKIARMKFVRMLAAVFLAGLAGCSSPMTPDVHRPHPAAWDIPETVVITYHVQSGKEVVFPILLAQAWSIYRHEHMVRSEPHVIVREREEDGKIRYVETLTWVRHSAPDNAPADVREIWNQEVSDCEGRNGHPALEGGEVQLVLP